MNSTSTKSLQRSAYGGVGTPTRFGARLHASGIGGAYCCTMPITFWKVAMSKKIVKT